MQIRYINPNGNKIELDDWPKSRGYLLQNWEGFGEIPVSIQTQKAPFQDGETLIDQLLNPRNMTVDLVMFGDSKQEVYDKRRELQKLFNPKLGAGILQWEQEDGTTYEIECVPDSSPQFPGGNAKSNYHQTALIYLRAPNPFWKDIIFSGTKLGFIGGGFKFPLMLNDTTFGRRGYATNLENEGDVPTSVLITFYGPALNPKVENQTTGEFVKINEEIADGEKIIINTTFGQKSVILDDGVNRINAFGKIDLNSTFWKLQTNDNIIDFDSDIDKADAKVEIRYKNRYIGV